ncbi:MAG: hypothetical protein EA412_04400 [Chitinophagaceae bacterium]|nr:MAG: hypothetical protein EA412_04400 [Chitinophagaceae bacterium]
MKNYLFLILVLSVLVSSCKKDNDDLPSSGEPIVLTGWQEEPRTLENRFSDPNASDYIVESTWLLRAHVIVEPGVRIEMSSGARINVAEGGILTAEGTEDEPILFIGSEPVAGYWDYIRFDHSNSVNNILSHTIIRYGGGYSTSFTDAAVFVNNDSRLTLKNSEISHSATNGFKVNFSSGIVQDFKNNTISHCQQYPIKLASIAQIATFDETSIFVSNNTYEAISVEGAHIESPLSIPKVNGPIILNGLTYLKAAVSVDAGSEFLMGPSSRIEVTQDASLNMIGTENNRITFTGREEMPGYWDYIRFNNSNYSLNELQYVDVSYGGGGPSGAFADAIIFVNGGGYVKMGNSSVNYSEQYGVKVRNQNGNFVDEGNNTFTGNLLGDISLP